MKIRVVESVLKANDAVARENRRRMDEAGMLCVNVMSAPGSGKTTLLQKTIVALGADRCGVLVGDLQTTRDAERLGESGARSIQINTGKGCHLSATQVAEGLSVLDMSGLSYLFIENVGNMVCPTGVDLGEHARVALLSLPEGDDKVAKYPTLFQAADMILLTKIDLLGVLEYDTGRVRDDLRCINTAAPLLEVCSVDGRGVNEWLEWLWQRRSAQKAGSGDSED